MQQIPLRNKEQWQELSQTRRGGSVKWNRLIKRSSPFHQSAYYVNVRWSNLPGDSTTKWAVRYLIFRDWFDFMLSMKTTYLVFWLIVVYTVLMIIWAGFYMAIDCADIKNPLSFQEAFAFSLETATTVGYTLVRDQNVMFFGGCENWIVAIYFQSIVHVLVNGFVLGVVMMRMQRANRRSRQIVFSDKACVICIRGKFYLTCQVFDLQAFKPIIGVSVRLLSVFHEPSDYSPAFFQTRVMRLTRPDDETGSKLWLTIPSIVMHEIDIWSPLAPLELSHPPKIPESSAPNRFPQPIQRSLDARTGEKQQSICIICGTAFLTEGGLRRHIEYMKYDEAARGMHLDFGHRNLDPKDVSHPIVARVDDLQEPQAGSNCDFIAPEFIRDAIRTRLTTRKIEILVIVEGLDPLTSNLMQARHSYTIDDIEFDKQHVPCMTVNPDSGQPRINLSLFHKLYAHPTVNVERPIPFASHS